MSIINQSTADANGNITFSAGADMSWTVNLMMGKMNSSLDRGELSETEKLKIKRIQEDLTLSVTERADKIASVYENYLYSLAPEAFDKYDKIRKIYKNPSSPERIASEKELAEELQGLPVDIKQVARNMADDDLKIATKGFGIDVHTEFVGMVNTKKPLDLKLRTFGESEYSIWARGWKGNPQTGTIYEGQPSTDYLGNYLYGYYGQGCLTLNGEGLKYGAGAAQQLSDAKNLKVIGDWNWYGDNEGDSEMIQEGIDDYNAIHKKK